MPFAANACDPSQNGFTPLTGYVVDPAGQQLTEVAWANDGWNQWNHTNVYAGGKLIATYDVPAGSPACLLSSTGAPAAPCTTALHIHIDDPLGTRRVQVADATGLVEATYQSLPFGDGLTTTPYTATATSEDPTENHFTNKERDTESGNDYFLARYYNSNTGRFLSPDWSSKVAPVPYAKLDDPQSLNLYAYVENQPISQADPGGHEGCTVENAGPADCGTLNSLAQAGAAAVDNRSEGEHLTDVLNSYNEQSTDQTQQGQWSTTPPASGHYLTNAYFPKGAGGAGHWGVGLDTPDKTVGFATNDGVPKFLRAILLAIGVPLPGAIHDDSMVNQSGVEHFYRPLTAAQFDSAQSAMNNRVSHSGLYSLYLRNCALWDQSVDHAAGIGGVPHIVAFPMVLRLWYPQQ